MSILFCLDAKLVKKGDIYYTTGAVDFEYFNSFKTNCRDDIMRIICREESGTFKEGKIAKTSGKGLEIMTISSYRDLLKKKNRRDIRALIANSDMFVIKQPTVIGSFVCHFLRKKKMAYIVNMVGCPFDSYRNRGILGKIVAPMAYLITKHYVKYATSTIYVTNTFLQNRYPTRGNSFCISDVIIGEQDDMVLKERLSRIANWHSKAITIGTIGAVDVSYKGQHYVLKAMKKLKKKGFIVNYELVGNGNKQRLQKIAERYGVRENVKFLGSMPHQDIFKWLHKIDIYVHPSNVEGLCRSIIEAMSMACPCIVSDAGGNKELVSEQWVFKKKDVNDLCDKIIEMLGKGQMSSASKINYIESKKYGEKKLAQAKSKIYEIIRSR